MERKERGSTDTPDTRSQPQPSNNDIPSVGTFNYASAGSACHNEITDSQVSEQNVPVPPRTSTSTLNTTGWGPRPTTKRVPKSPQENKTKTSPSDGDEAISLTTFTEKHNEDDDDRTTTKRAPKSPEEKKTKTSPSDGDDAISVTFTKKDYQEDDDATANTSLVSPGAVSVPGCSLAGSPNNELDKPLELVDSRVADQAPSLVVAAQLVTHHHNDYEQDEDLENRIKQEVEERLKKRDPTLAVAEVVPPITTTCKQFCWKWKYLLAFLLLGICGAIVGVKLSAESDETPSPEGAPTVAPTSIDEQPTRNSTRDNETQARIQEVLGRYNLTIEADPTNESPQSRAWEWLLYNDTNTLMQNGTISDSVILERYVLAVFYYSTNGNMWLNELEFLTPATVCQWNNGSIASAYGVLCDADGTVHHIELSGNSLSGSLPSELSLLSNLQRLSLVFNMLGNVVPTELGQLTALQVLSLSDNQLNGTLPIELGQPTNVQTFLLEFNSLFGTWPTELGNLVSLETLGLGYNQFTGTVPTEFGRLTNLQGFEIYGNYMSGSLPTELGLMTSLTSIIVGDPGFTGTLPTELGRLTNLEYFSPSYCNFTGPLPTELGLMTSLTLLDVDSNFLTGTLPTELGLMTSLIGIFAPYNMFTGTLPTELIQLTALELLHVYNNYLNGTVPEELLSKSDLQVDFDPQMRTEEIGGD